MAGEKNFENRLKDWLESEGIYPLGHPEDKMTVPPCGFYEKRWGGSRYVKSGLPDMRITVKGIALEVELKATDGTPSVLQKRNLAQINGSQGFGFILYPEGFEAFKTIPDLKAYIETELEKLHSAKIADAEEVMKYLTSVMRGEHTEEIPILCGDGCQELTQKEVGAKERLKAAELIGKRYGMFTDKVGVERAVPVIIMGDDQLED